MLTDGEEDPLAYVSVISFNFVSSGGSKQKNGLQKPSICDTLLSHVTPMRLRICALYYVICVPVSRLESGLIDENLPCVILFEWDLHM